jgi:ABC-type transport system substrate-binding protein
MFLNRIFKITVLLSALVLALSAVSCGNKTAVSAAPSAGSGGDFSRNPAGVDTSRKTTANSGERYPKIVIGITADPQDMLPYDINGKPYTSYNIYECLFDFEGGDYIPVLTKEFTVVDDTHYDVEIYDYIYDHGGNHITADDVLYSFKVLIDSGYNYKWANFKSVEKRGDYVVRFTWNGPVTGVGDLEFPWCRAIIFSQAAYEKGGFATQPLGTGPYRVSQYVGGSTIVFEAVDNYWQKDKSKISRRHEANVQTIQYDIIAETSQHVIALKSGAIQFSDKIPFENFDDFGQDNNFVVHSTQGRDVYALIVNQLEGSIGADPNFRKAVFYAIDNAACAVATNNITVPARAFGTPALPDYVRAWDTVPTYINTYDAAKAKEFLALSNYNGQTLTLLGPNTELEKNLMTMIQAFLLNIGVNIRIYAANGNIVANSSDDSSAWDLLIFPMGGGLQVGQWNRALNYNEFSSQRSMGFIHDETLQQKYMFAQNVNSYNDASMTDLHNYIIDKAYHYAVVTNKLNMVYSSKVADLFLRESITVHPGGCVYYLD